MTAFTPTIFKLRASQAELTQEASLRLTFALVIIVPFESPDNVPPVNCKYLASLSVLL